MEQAIFISKVKDIKYIDSKYKRLYFGNEFCQRLIPSMEDMKVVEKFVLERQMSLTLVTPYVTKIGIELLKPILEYITVNLPEAEVVINDWGVLRLIIREFKCSNLNLGRLLTKQKRGPRILNLKNKVPHDMIQHFKQTNSDIPILSDFLMNSGVKRIEMDNLLQGIDRQDHSLKSSLYFPFAYVTTSRFCLAAYSGNTAGYFRSISNCNKECQRYAFKLNHKSMPVDLILKGNTQFFRNGYLPENLEQLNIDRLVYQPEIPL